MATLSELFVLLDGWTEQRFSEGIHLAPDPALEGARSALASGAGLEEALAAVEQQIAVAAPALRAARYDLIEDRAGSGTKPTVETMRHMLCDLHLAAFRIQRRLGAVGAARAHLVRAAATESGDDTPRLYFVELYVTLSEYAAAVETLTAAMARDTFGAFSLFELGADLLSNGATTEARTAFERAAEFDPVGLVTSACHILSDDLNRASLKQPTADELQTAFVTAARALDEGREPDALDGFLFVAAHAPKASRAWFGAGCAHRNSVEREEAVRRGGDAADLVSAFAEHLSETVTDHAHNQMAYAADAFRLALALEPTMWPAADALVWAELWLDRLIDGLQSAHRAADEQPGDPNALATLSFALLMNGALGDAQRAAAAALKAHPGNQVARQTLAIARKVAPGVPAP